MLSLRTFLFAATALAALPAYAADRKPCCRGYEEPKWYAGVSGSLVYLRDTDIKNSSTIPGFSPTDTVKYDYGLGFSGAIGYRFLEGVRGEIELAYRTNDADSVNGGPLTNPPGTHSPQKSLALMANGYVDLRNNSDFTPYFGAGVGVARVKSSRYYFITSGGNVVETLNLKEYTLAYQFMTGVSYRIDTTYTPFELNLGYRYFTGLDSKSEFKTDPGVVKYPNDSHNLELGGKMYF